MAKAEYEEKLRAQSEAALAQLEELKATRQQREEYVENIARQRDMYRTMLHSVQGAMGQGTPPGPTQGGTPGGAAGEPAPDYTAMLADVQTEAERIKVRR